MTTTVKKFRQSATIAIEDVRLQSAYDGATRTFQNHRTNVLAALPHADELRDHFKKIRAATLAQLGRHLETFESNAQANGATVHWAETGDQACDIVLKIAQQNDVRLITKSKSMATEEIHLNQRLEASDITPVETDLGEWIIQLAKEPPSHIIAPAIHKTRHQVAELFTEYSGTQHSPDDVEGMTATARGILRENFLSAGIGISGGNMLIAETGSVIMVENEGNGRMVTSATPIHIAIVGIEKVARNWDDAAVWLQLLARSATGQPMSIYTSAITGPKRPEDPDGPEQVHIILLDNGRSKLVGTKYEEALQCIRCGACLNACPVYQEAGGHAYDSPYSGPIGAIISPLLFGLDKYPALPYASTLCGSCKEVCPARIDIPRILLDLREDAVYQNLTPLPDRVAQEASARVLLNQRIIGFFTKALRGVQTLLIKDDGISLPITQGRQLPKLADKSFREMWQDGEVG